MVDTLPAVRLPQGPITPHGAYHVLRGDVPLMWLTSYDGSVQINLMGGINHPDPTKPESVQVQELKALGASWKIIKQKGATQDGETFIDALYDSAEPTMKVAARGRDRAHTRAVERLLRDSLDAIKTGELAFFTPDVGKWWADIRLLKTIPDPVSSTPTRQVLSLMLGIDDAFWESTPNVDTFEFEYDSVKDLFSTDYPDDAGPNWPVYYYDGPEAGHVKVHGGQLSWSDDNEFDTEGRSVMLGPYKDFQTETDNQVIQIEFGSFQELTIEDGAENHIWARCGQDDDGNWDGNGVRASIGPFAVELARFNDFVKHTMRVWPNLPSLPGEHYTFIAGFETNTRHFQIKRNGLGLFDHIEGVGGGSPLGADFRGIGTGMRAGAALITQVTPASVRGLSAGDNVTVAQQGYLDRQNVGDQDMFDELTIFGPASSVKIWNGPEADATDYVEIKNILPNQVFFIRTDPRKRIIQDLTSTPPSPQELDVFQSALKSFLTFAVGKGALAQQIESVFGITPPQGNVNTLVTGRFSNACAIPPKSPGAPAQTYHVKVSIDGGNASSKIIASGTPRRRMPY